MNIENINIGLIAAVPLLANRHVLVQPFSVIFQEDWEVAIHILEEIGGAAIFNVS